jgi:putative amide transporter protein
MTGVWQDHLRTAAIVLAVLLLLSLALYPRLHGPGEPAGPEPAPELREGEPAGQPVRPPVDQQSTDAPSHRRR